jgi:hypothetical protein
MTPLAGAARKLNIGLALPLVLFAACSPTLPQPTSESPAPTSVAFASAVPTASPLASPSTSCEQPQVVQGVSYASPTCQAALNVAVKALPADHPPIRSLDFAYGFFCGPGRYCSLYLPPDAHVIVTYTNGEQVFVNVRGEEDGDVTLIGGPLPMTEPSAEPST